MLKKLNLPNKLSLLRIILVPVFILFMVLVECSFKWAVWAALITFILASITDAVDGKISRKYKLITDFGKLVDPLADKLLVASAFIMITGAGVIPAWITAIVIFRDLWVDTLRVFAAKNNVAMGASLSGKVKTIFTMSSLSLALLDLAINTKAGFFTFTTSISMSSLALLINVFMSVALVGTVVVTIWSLIDYTIKAKKYINVEK